ncbi:glycosyltransferase [Flavobacterium branchiophilum]|uniref:Glycosyl transferase, group 2 family protein n=1 Tax=Flavobacterium branchiophilum (strain FL-15) TaxID=1034807 RepID=G2Z680_FLABF|nr:glycosyltransferase family 2 protein [Flavobacterium branchiophilum]CCB70900.1 Glycosyl transferase, group 2 family protein [Flavobacterium branchiophilum FL-15]
MIASPLKIAIVILNWNGKTLLEQFLPSVLQFSDGVTVYVADNASTDDSVLWLQNHYPEVQIIQNAYNFGFAQGYNEALQQVDADVYALVNSDIEVTHNWLVPIIQTFENEPNTAIIQPKILDFKKQKYFEYAGAAGGFIDRFGFPFCRGRFFDTIEEDCGQYNDNTTIFWASGACFFIRKPVFDSLKGFDPDFFAHQEEIDLCWRAINQHYHIKYVSQSTVYHVGGATLEQGNPQKTYLNFRNSLLMLTKNLPQNQLYSTLFFRLILDGLAGIQFLTKGKWSHIWAIIKAHFKFYQMFVRFYKKRNNPTIQTYYKVQSIVYLYFIKRQKKYSDLKKNSSTDMEF